MKITVEYTEREKVLQKAFRDTITGGLEIIGKYAMLFLLFGGLPIWMILDYLSKGCY